MPLVFLDKGNKMKIKIRGFITHKQGETYSNCADNYDFAHIKDKNIFRVAISDGVTQSLLPQKWSELLVANYVSEDNLSKDISKIAEEAQKKWLVDFHAYVQKQLASGQINSVIEQQINQGYACATLAGLEFKYSTDKNEWQWSSELLGDSVIIYQQDNEDNDGKFSVKVETSVKQQDNKYEFDNYPNYFIGRDRIYKDGKYQDLRKSNGTPQEKKSQRLTNGTFLLITDALAEYYLNYLKITDMKDPISQIIENDQDSFLNNIEKLRAEGKLKDDDTTIICLEISEVEKDELDSEGDLMHLTELTKKNTENTGTSHEIKKFKFEKDKSKNTSINNKKFEKDKSKNTSKNNKKFGKCCKLNFKTIYSK
ncbi:MAG: hypothetical protein RLZZ293_905 [Pseudomonadota bacterium]|jgi:hypothetical protein